MQKVRVHNFHMSLDGYAAGSNEHRDKPFGDVDNDFAAAGDSNIGATIMGGKTFAEISAKWDDGCRYL